MVLLSIVSSHLVATRPTLAHLREPMERGPVCVQRRSMCCVEYSKWNLGNMPVIFLSARTERTLAIKFTVNANLLAMFARLI